jgi:hypothetical protein
MAKLGLFKSKQTRLVEAIDKRNYNKVKRLADNGCPLSKATTT